MDADSELKIQRMPEEGAPVLSLPVLLLLFLKIGTIGFGGGMAMIALMEREIVVNKRAMEAEEFLHGVGLGQVLGPFAVNTALFVGSRLYGPLGGLACAFAFMAPSVLIVILLAWFYFSFHSVPALQNAIGGVGPVVIALILAAAWSMSRKAVRSWPSVLMAVLALGPSLLKINAVYVLIVAGLIGLVAGKRIFGKGQLGKSPVREKPQTPGAGPPAACRTRHTSCCEHYGWRAIPGVYCIDVFQGRLCFLRRRVCSCAHSSAEADDPGMAHAEGVHRWGCDQQSDARSYRCSGHFCGIPSPQCRGSCGVHSRSFHPVSDTYDVSLTWVFPIQRRAAFPGFSGWGHTGGSGHGGERGRAPGAGDTSRPRLLGAHGNQSLAARAFQWHPAWVLAIGAALGVAGVVR